MPIHGSVILMPIHGSLILMPIHGSLILMLSNTPYNVGHLCSSPPLSSPSPSLLPHALVDMHALVGMFTVCVLIRQKCNKSVSPDMRERDPLPHIGTPLPPSKGYTFDYRNLSANS